MADVERRNRGRSPARRRWRSPFTRFFDDIMSDLESELPEVGDAFSGRRFAPAIDVYEDDKQVGIKAELPGMTKDDVEITVENGVLTLRGEKEQTEEQEGKDYHRVERRYGRFERSFRLPEYADETSADATFSDGILTISLPKEETAKAKTIEVKGE